MSENKVVVLTDGNVQGDITTCRIEDVVTEVKRSGAISLTEVQKHRVYNVCTKEVVNEYEVPYLSGEASLFMIVVVLMVLLTAFFKALNWATGY